MDIDSHHDDPDITKEASVRIEPEADLRAEARKHRLAALRRVAGIWADRTDIPADGLQYERELRDEWR